MKLVIAVLNLINPADRFMDITWKVSTYGDGTQYLYFIRVPPPCTEFAPIIPPPDPERFYLPSFGQGPCINSKLAPKIGPTINVDSGENLDLVFEIAGWPDYPLHPGEPHGIIVKLGNEAKKAARGETSITFTNVLGDKLELEIAIEGAAFLGNTPLTRSCPTLLPLIVSRT
ncbi:MAG TPA: hypothetical protein PK812_09135 [Beijerinckiaceae bacterium]|nr:hypothetical protein [Beijerinckiaceae bacterium]